MREIKFRAWEIEKEEMIPVDDINFNGDGLINTRGAWRAFSEVELMQCTGLKDKYGVDIYEGDIVRWHDVVTWDYSVTFKDGVFCIADDPSSNFYHLKEDINGKFEVIGNIYENPELLEEITK